MAVFETWLESDLRKPVQVKQLTGNLFSADNGGNKIGVRIFDGGEAASVSGTVTGYVLREDGSTVTVNGTLSDNNAYIVLPASAYVVVGRVSIVIKLGTTTVGACTAYVYRTTTDTIVDPGSVVPSISELLAKIGDCETATAAATSAATAAGYVNISSSKSGNVITIVTTNSSNQQTSTTVTEPTTTVTESNGTVTVTCVDANGTTTVSFEKIVVDDTAGDGDTDKVWSADKSASEVADLQSAIDRKADCVYETLSDQPLAHFEDGADNLPVTDLVVGIEPVQDLNGQEYPWPAGGSNNLIPDGTDTSNGFVSSKMLTEDGTETTTSTSRIDISEYFPVEAETQYTFSYVVGQYGYNVAGICFYDANKSYISGITVNNVNPLTFTTPTGAAYCRTSKYKEQYGILTQIELGAIATEIKPYSNICPITGWTGATICRKGKNLFDKTNVVSGYYIDSSGARKSVSGGYIANFMRIKENTTYRISQFLASNLSRYMAFYTGTSASDVISTVKPTYTGDTFTTPAGTKYMRFSTVGDYLDSLMITEGDGEQGSYDAYAGNEYSFSFGETPGTVYGATLNVKTGVLTVDRANITSYNGETLPGEWISDRDAYSAGGTPTTGAQVVYKLATALTYQLTPTEVRTLLGENNIWADTGDVKTLTYPCDTKKYISKALSASQRIMELIVTANREDSMTASKAYSSGDLLIVNNTLYKASTSIANGATLTVGTNVTETTVGAELATISGEIATGVSF